MRKLMLQARENLQLKQTDLMGLWIRSNQHQELIRILDIMYVSTA